MKHGTPVGWRPLLLLGAAVLAAHLLLLGARPGRIQVSAKAVAQPFLVRTVPSAPVLTPAVEALQRSTTPQPPAVRRGAGLTSRVAEPGSNLAAPAAATAMPVFPAPALSVASVAPVEPTNDRGAAERFAIAGSVRLRYEVAAQVRGQSRGGEGELVWRHDGEIYEARLSASVPAQPARVQRSTGRITAAGLEPLRFSDKARTEEAAHFQRADGKVIFSSNKPDAPLLAGAQDRLSVLLQLGAMLAGQPDRFLRATALEIQVAGTRDAERWVFIVEQEELLQLPGGTVSAVKMTRLPQKEFDQKVEVWLAPGMDYVPVRLRLTQPNGDSVNYQWSSTDKG